MLTSLLAFHYHLPAGLALPVCSHTGLCNGKKCHSRSINAIGLPILCYKIFSWSLVVVFVCVCVWSILSQGSVFPAVAASGTFLCVWEALFAYAQTVISQSRGSVIVCEYVCWNSIKKGGGGMGVTFLCPLMGVATMKVEHMCNNNCGWKITYVGGITFAHSPLSFDQ